MLRFSCLIFIVISIEFLHRTSLILFLLHILSFHRWRTFKFIPEFHVFLILNLALCSLSHSPLMLLILIFLCILRFLIKSRVHLIFRHSHGRRLRQIGSKIVFYFIVFTQLMRTADGVIVRHFLIFILFMLEFLIIMLKVFMVFLKLPAMFGSNELLGRAFNVRFFLFLQ